MEYVQFTDFRNHSKDYFDRIEEGESYIIVRRGKPVARMLPFEQPSPGWKRSLKRIKLKAGEKTTMDYIAEERSER
jgi:prevent-host-death family protein